ncbi:MAG: hypothetical protein NC402_05695 [Prevotella sp.]|nr:hypothetical protein [Prevotella sp.]MCM1074579.1 hypothetical protein [Ruminococcus sp.]
MKRTIYTLSAVCVLLLTSCGGHSGKTGEQIDNAHEQAKQMLQKTHSKAATLQTSAQQPETTDTLQ